MLTQRSLLLCLVCLASLLVSPIFQPALSTQTVQSAPQALIQNPYADLAIGVGWEDLNVGGTDYEDAGAVQVLFGSASGLSGDYDQLLSQNDQDNPEQVGEFDYFGEVLAFGDLNCDGFADLAIGVPGEYLGAIETAGIMQIYNGSITGMVLPGGEVWHQDIPGIQDAAEDYDWFGSTLASGDFNGDGCDDLAVGAYGESFATLQDLAPEDIQGAGAVNILYGSPNGIATLNNNFFYQIPALDETIEHADHFGSSLAAGDFNGDHYTDLAIGVPDEDFEGADTYTNAGVVHVLYGSSAGLSLIGALLLSQDDPQILGQSESDDNFGDALASADFNGDGKDDLAISAPGESYDFGAGEIAHTGVVHVLFGSQAGLSKTDLLLTQTGDTPSVSEPHDYFGQALAVGQIHGDRNADLVVGVPSEDIGEILDAGAINVFFGHPVGFNTAITQQMWHSQPVAGDNFGWSLALADFDADGFDDLAIGVPFRNFDWDSDSKDDAGVVLTCPGSANGVLSTCYSWHQGLYIAGYPEDNDRFGYSLTAAPPIFRNYLPLVRR